MTFSIDEEVMVGDVLFESGMSPGELAELFGVTRQAISFMRTNNEGVLPKARVYELQAKMPELFVK